MKKLILATLFLTLFSAAKSSAQSFLAAQEKNYYVKSKGYSSNPESDPPQYVNQLNKTKIEAFKNIDWIDAGLAYRMRLENRRNDFRRSIDKVDNPILSRTQAYFGIKNILDPLRFAIELQDSRIYNSHFERNNADVNKLDLFQAYGELYFKNPTLLDRPISIRAGRMAFEVIDRKLFSRDDWGNTGNNFQGFRATIGKQENDWQFDSFALQPIIESTNKYDHRNKNQWIYAGILNWRRWSEIITLQPFYFQFNQIESSNGYKRQINSPGLRLYGDFGDSNFDYNLIGIYQFGENNNQTHRAYAHATEIGYTQQHQWRPRYSLTYGYASGDKNSNDNKNQRFEKFYGFNRPWSSNNHIEWENLKTIKSRIEFQPYKKLQIDSSYSHYWLASNSDDWKRGNLQDSSGNSGNSIGQDFDVRMRYNVAKNINTTFGYAHFIPGKFTRNIGRNNPSNFLYLELHFSLFG